jgi:two-component system OmpR family response regulator
MLSRDRLLDITGRRGSGPFDRAVDVQIGRLRRKLGEDSMQPRLIKTLRGGGYMFVPAVETVMDRSPVLSADLPLS